LSGPKGCVEISRHTIGGGGWQAEKVGKVSECGGTRKVSKTAVSHYLEIPLARVVIMTIKRAFTW
jgi:hypothetical protein